jgi:hypothetical protein
MDSERKCKFKVGDKVRVINYGAPMWSWDEIPGARVHPRLKQIELDEQLFRYSSALLKTYLYKLKKLGYEIQSFIPMK